MMELDKALDIVGHRGYGYPEDEAQEAFEMVMDLAQKNLDTQETQDKGKEPLYFRTSNQIMKYPAFILCGKCGYHLLREFDYCPKCGRLIDWGE